MKDLIEEHGDARVISEELSDKSKVYYVELKGRNGQNQDCLVKLQCRTAGQARKVAKDCSDLWCVEVD